MLRVDRKRVSSHYNNLGKMMVALVSPVVAEKVRSSQVLDVFKNHSQQKLLTYLEKLPALKFNFFSFFNFYYSYTKDVGIDSGSQIIWL